MTDEINTQLYARQLVLKEIGGAGQQKLAAARVLIVGMGGLGCPLALYLAACGVGTRAEGTIGLLDPDHVDASNLSRQILYTPNQLGVAKVQAAQEKLLHDFASVHFTTHQETLTAENAADLIASYDIIADCLDNFEARLALSDACAQAQKPLVSAAAIGFKGHISTFKPYLRDATGEAYPTYRCWVGEQPQMEDDCQNFGVLGSVTGLMGTLQATEVIKEITGAGQSLAGRMIIADCLTGDYRVVRLRRDPANTPAA